MQSEAEVDTLTLPVDTPVAYITQTTLSVDDTRGIIEALQRRFTDLVGPDTRHLLRDAKSPGRRARAERTG